MRFLSLLILRLTKLRAVLLQPEFRRILFRHGVLAGVEHKPVLNRPLSTVIDIGANRGQFALAARVISGANVISFEPLPKVAAVFQKIFHADPAVELYVAAIGEQSGKKLMHLSARDDSSSLLPIGDAQPYFFPGTHEVGTLAIDVGTLDEFVSREQIVQPAMLKLDVQGFELQALAGCRELIDCFNYVYCECSFVELYKEQKLAGDVINFLYSSNFKLVGIYHSSYDRDGNCIQADFLFERI